jgi:hypothetical protein
MGARGRNSSIELIASLDAAKRPEPPPTLNEEAAEEWRSVVAGLPPDWFSSENLAMLEQRCNHVVWMRTTAALTNSTVKGKKFKPEVFAGLMRLATLQARTLLQLDAAMRLTQQSSYDKSKRKGTGARNPKATPWKDAAE